MGDKRILVVVVTYNSAGLLADCLHSVLTDGHGYRLREVVVADNGSHDQTIAVAMSFADVQVVELGRNAGYAAGVNAALATIPTGTFDAVLVLNPDIRLRSGCIARLVADLERPGIGIAVPRLVNPDGSLQVSLRRDPTVLRAFVEAVLGGTRAGRLGSLGELVTRHETYAIPQRASWATGAAMLISSRALRQTGRWDESLLLYGEEVDFALRARDRGFGLWYDPLAVAEHVGGELTTVPDLYALMTVNRVRVYRKRHGRVRASLFYSAVLLGELARAAGGRSIARAAVSALLWPSTRSAELPQHA